MKKLFTLFNIMIAAVVAAAGFVDEKPEKYWDIDLLKIKPKN